MLGFAVGGLIVVVLLCFGAMAICSGVLYLVFLFVGLWFTFVSGLVACGFVVLFAFCLLFGFSCLAFNSVVFYGFLLLKCSLF